MEEWTEIAGIFDSHAHYDDAAFDADRTEVLNALPQKGISYVMNVASDFMSAQAGISLTEQFPFVYSSVGIHPEFAQTLSKSALGDLERWLDYPKVKAVGEIGLDYHYDGYSKKQQWNAFERQMELAERTGYPVIIHSRDAVEDTLAILRSFPKVKGVVHCFSGSVQTAQELLKMGYYIGFTGVITFSNAKKAVLAAESVPLERLLIETDCPYMAPVPMRGKRCDSTMLPWTAARLAEIHQIATEELIRQTCQNALALYRISKMEKDCG